MDVEIRSITIAGGPMWYRLMALLSALVGLFFAASPV
jgi:hypothetical protein